jgi:hypothetical protein
MAATPQNKLLRVGVIQNGRIVEEHHVRREHVTIGHDARNTIVLPAAEDRPARFALLVNQDQQFHLVIDEHMRGRVNLGSSDVDFDVVRKRGMATRRGNLYVLPLQETARGKVELGDATLFFQFVTPPAPKARAEVPIQDVRTSPWKTMDRVFFGILAASLFIHFSGATLIIFSETPKEPELALDQLDDRFVRAIIPQRLAEPTKVADTGPAEEVKDEPKGDDSGEAKDKPAAKPSGDAAERRAEVVKKVSGKGLLKILGSNSGGGQGAFADVLGGASGGGDIAEALAGAGGVGVATEASVGSGGTGPRGGGTGKVTGIGEVGTQGGGKVDLGGKKEAKVEGSVRDAAPDIESSDVDRNALARYVRSRLKSIQSCYEKELKRNPSLKGKVVVRFTIKPSGRAGDIEIEENTLGSEAVGSCIRTTIRSWVFPFKPDSETAVSYPFVFAPAG